MDDAGQATVVWLRTENPPGLRPRDELPRHPGSAGHRTVDPGGDRRHPGHPLLARGRRLVTHRVDRLPLGDGGTGSGSSVTRTFAAVGFYPVSVTATDAVSYATTLTGPSWSCPPAPPVTTPTTPAHACSQADPFQVLLTRKTIHVVGSDEKPRATKLKLSLNVDATVVVKLKRTAKVNGKAAKAKQSKAMKSGQRAIRLTSKVGGKRLAAGTYRISVRATNAAGSSAAETVKLKVVK